MSVTNARPTSALGGVIKVTTYEAYCEVCDWSESFSAGDHHPRNADGQIGTRLARERAQRAWRDHRCPEYRNDL